MARITFRPDDELVAVLEKAERDTGLTSSELCRLSIAEWVAKQKPEQIIKANVARRIKSARGKTRTAA